MKQANLLLTSLTIAISVLLTGCEPYAFGIPQSQFNALTPTQQNEVIKGYNQQRALEAQYQPSNTNMQQYSNNSSSSSASVVVNNTPATSAPPPTNNTSNPGQKNPTKEGQRNSNKPAKNTRPHAYKPSVARPAPALTPTPTPTPAPQPEPTPAPEPKSEAPTPNEASNTQPESEVAQPS